MENQNKTSNARKGGLFVGNSHDDGGMSAIVVDTGQPIEVEGGEVIINKVASKKYWKELSEINQSAGNGVAIPSPSDFSKDVSKYKGGGKITMSAIKQGTEIEMEHAKTIRQFKNKNTDVRQVAHQIAKDHLKENPNYYKIITKLKLKTGGEIVCRSCGEDWIESTANKYMCPKCKSDNKNFYKSGGGKIEDSNGYLSYTIDEDEITLDMIQSYDKRKGTASKLIKKLKDLSRKNKLPIGLYAEPQDFSISDDDLIEFYYKNGFELDPNDSDGKLFIWNYSDGGIILLAPNGKPSNLTPEQYKLVRTPAFKKWFGDWENDLENSSKVVDENGEPKVMYSGSPNEFTIFETDGIEVDRDDREYKSRFWFIANKGNAEDYSRKATGNISSVYEVFLNIRNPKNDFNLYVEDNNDGSVEFRGLKIWVAIATSSNQIKLADGTNTTFDGNNPDIRYAGGGGVNQDFKYSLTFGGITIYTNTEQEYVGEKYSPFESKGSFKASVRKTDLVNIAIESEQLKNFNFQWGVDDWKSISQKLKNKGINKLELYLTSGIIKSYELKVLSDSKNPDIRFDKGGSVLLAPNGKPSNLTAEQYKLVRSSVFKKWFGDWENSPKTASKVVDSNGEPLPVYHGTKFTNEYYNFDLDTIDESKVKAFFFSSGYTHAKRYTYSVGYIRQFFINIRKLFDPKTLSKQEVKSILSILNEKLVSELNNYNDDNSFFDELKKQYGIYEITINLALFHILTKTTSSWQIIEQPSFQNYLIENRYEGFKTSEQSNLIQKGNENFAVYSPTQIKLADGSNTTFHEDNSDIRFDTGGEIENTNLFMKWFVNWYKGIYDKMNIAFSLPSIIAPFKEDNVVILDVFEKIDQSIDAKPYLEKITEKADEYNIFIYLEPKPRHKYLQDNLEKKNKITKEYLIEYYKKFGFQLTPNNRIMKRFPKSNPDIQFYIIKENKYGEDVKHIVTPEPSELKVGLSNQKWMPKGIVSMFKPLRTSTLYYETININDCIDFIKKTESIVNNGFYLNLGELANKTDAYGQIPLNLQQTIITYNSGNQTNLKITDTINSSELSIKLQSLLNIDSSQAYLVLQYFIDNARRFDTLEILKEIKDTEIIIIDRDNVVCSSPKFMSGGNIEINQLDEYVIFFKSELLKNIVIEIVQATSLQEAINNTKDIYSFSEIKWIRGFKSIKSSDDIRFFYENIKEKWETKPNYTAKMSEGQISLSVGNEIAEFDFYPVFTKEKDLKIFKEGYLIHNNIEIKVDSDFNFDKNKVFKILSTQKYATGGTLIEQQEIMEQTTIPTQKGLFEENENQLNIFDVKSFATGGAISTSRFYATKVINNWNEIPSTWKNTNKISKVNAKLDPNDDKFNSIFNRYLDTDKFRTNMSGYNVDKNGITVTNAHILAVIPTKEDLPKGVFLKGKEIETKYPNYSAVIPKEFASIQKFDCYKLLQYCRVALNYANKTTHKVVFKIEEEFIGFNANFIIITLETALKLGHEELYINFTTPSRASIFSPIKTPTLGKDLFLLVMPVMVNQAYDDKRSFGVQDIDYGLYLNCYFDFSKNEIINGDGSVANFEMDYGNNPIFTDSVIDVIKQNVDKKSNIAILENFLVQNNTIKLMNFSSDEIYDLTIKDVKAPQGLYLIQNKVALYNSEDIEDYPKTDEPTLIQSKININAEYFKWIIDTLELFKGNDDLRPVMNGLSINCDRDSLYFASTNAHQLGRIKANESVTVNNFVEEGFKVIIPFNKISDLLKFADNETIVLEIYGNLLNIVSDKFESKNNYINGRYPNYDAVVNFSTKNKLTLNKEKILKSLASKEAETFIKKYDKNSTKLVAKKENENLVFSLIKQSPATNDFTTIDFVNILTDDLIFSDNSNKTTTSSCLLLMPVKTDDDVFFCFDIKFFKDFIKPVTSNSFDLNYTNTGSAYIINENDFNYSKSIPTGTAKQKAKPIVSNVKPTQKADIIVPQQIPTVAPMREESIPKLIEGLEVLADMSENEEKQLILDTIEGLKILLEDEPKYKPIKLPNIDTVREKVNAFLNPLGYSANVEAVIGGEIHIEPSTKKVGKNRPDFFDGMQIHLFKDGTYEVSEYQAGKNKDELYIYKETPSLIIALKELIKGNNRKPIKKYETGGGINDNYYTDKSRFPNEGETLLPKDVDYDIMSYFDRTNRKLLITLKNGEKVKSDVGTFYNDLIFFGKFPKNIEYSHYRIQLKEFEKIEVLNDNQYAKGGELKMALGGTLNFKPITTPL